MDCKPPPEGVSAGAAPLTARQIATQVGAGRRRAMDVCCDALDRIAACDGRLHAFLEVTAEHAMEQAARVDAAIERGASPGPLAGVPVAVKDSLCTRFGHTTCGSRMLADYRSPFDATVVRRLEAAGAVIVGKTNLDEFQMGSSNEYSAFGPTRNPWNTQRVPGGSSGGSAAAVAAGMVPAAIGADTGGSIRQPAAFCGIAGLKPTYGRVSRYGLVAYGSSLDQIGPLARSVEDVALLLRVISGHDPADATSGTEPVPDYTAALSDESLERRARTLRVGVPRAYLDDGLDSETRAAVEAALAVYRDLGVTVIDVALPATRHAVACYYVIAMSECSSNLARYDGVRYGRRAADPRDIRDLYARSRVEGLGDEVRRRIILGTFALSAGYCRAYHDKALRVRRLVRDDFARAFEQCDVLAGPTSPAPAFALGSLIDDPLAMYLADVYTIGANLAGIPGLSVPCGLTRDGLPIGLQLMAPHWGEATLLEAARLYERSTPWHARRPPGAA